MKRDLSDRKRTARLDDGLSINASGFPAKWMSLLLSIVAMGLSCSASKAAPQSIADVFRGKTIRLLLPTSPGGGRGLYALPFADAYGRHIPGHPTVQPVFMPGAGGAVATNDAYNVAAPDGLTIVSPLKSVVTAQAIGDPSVKYDVSKFNWIGRITDATQIFYVSNKVKATKLSDFRSLQIVVGATGYSSPTYQLAAFVNYVFGTKLKIITGYESAANQNMAVASSETQGAFSTWNDVNSYHPDWIRDKKIKVLLQIALSKNQNFPDVPLMTDLATTSEDRQLCVFMSSSSDLGESFAAPPGVPPEVVAALRQAFDDTIKDPDLIKKFQVMKVQFNPMSGADLTKLIDDTIHASPSIIAKYKLAISRH